MFFPGKKGKPDPAFLKVQLAADLVPDDHKVAFLRHLRALPDAAAKHAFLDAVLAGDRPWREAPVEP
ncbi:MAG: hypothetical protein PVF51_03745 [Nitrospirota bacterium]